MRFASRVAATLLATGLLLADAAALSAQQPDGEHKPADQAAEEQKPPSEPTPEQAYQRAIDEFAEAASRLSPSAGVAECVWTGRRIASLLWRDDIDTARRYMDLYDRFGCSGEHLKLAFRCLVKQGPLDPKAADRLAARVHACWIAPKEPATASSQSAAGRTAKGGTVTD
jgi:hypothetical protein